MPYDIEDPSAHDARGTAWEEGVKSQFVRGAITRLSALLDKASERSVSLYLFYACLLVFTLTWADVVGGDSPGIAYLPASILRHGTLRLDPFINENPFFELSRSPHYVVASGGHYYSKFSIIPSLLALPVYAMGFSIMGGAPQDIYIEAALHILLSRLSSSLIAAIIIVIVFLTLRKLVRQSTALLLSLGYAFATFTWASATNTLASQSSGELFLVLGLLILVESESSTEGLGRWRAAGVGLSLALGVAARPQLLPAVTILTLYVARRTWPSWRSWLSYVAGAMPVVLLLLAYNQWAFGSPFATGYGDEAIGGWSTPLWIGLPAILFSPAHGLLVYAPVLLVGLIGGILLLRPGVALSSELATEDRKSFRLGSALATAALLQTVVMSHWHAWHGGVAYNQRMLEEIHPILILLTALLIQRYGAKSAFRTLIGLALGLGMFMNLARAAFYDQHLEWVERFHPEITWSLTHMEPVMYLRWHGFREWLAGLSLTFLQVGGVWLVSTFAFGWFMWRRMIARSQALQTE